MSEDMDYLDTVGVGEVAVSDSPRPRQTRSYFATRNADGGRSAYSVSRRNSQQHNDNNDDGTIGVVSTPRGNAPPVVAYHPTTVQRQPSNARQQDDAFSIVYLDE